MFFIASKILIHLLSPLSWIIVLLVLIAVTKSQKRRKNILLSALSLLIIFSNPFLLYLFASQWDIKPRQSEPSKKYSCAIVLGGFSSEDEQGDGFFNQNSDRFIQALKLKTTGTVSHLLISGGNSKINPGEFRESKWVHKQLLEFKIPDTSLVLEENSRNTEENARFSKLELEKRGLQPPYLLVTSAFHMRRAQYIFEKAGVNTVPYPCNYFTGRSKIGFDHFIPSPGTLTGWNTYIKEVIGLAVIRLKS